MIEVKCHCGRATAAVPVGTKLTLACSFCAKAVAEEKSKLRLVQ